MSKSQTLKYLFTATFNDGHVYEQNAEDRSLLEPEKRSCFFDIENYGKDKMTRFELKGDGHTYAVDLTDGHFEVDGIPFFMHGPVVEPIPGHPGKVNITILKDFRIIFWRQHRHSIEQKIRDEETISSREVAHEVEYQIGWQCTVDGKNHQEILRIK